jgi:heat-inducible transcriptional repressor
MKVQVPIFREKDKKILNSIVEAYLKIGKPISSGYIAQKSSLSVSPATIRNIMAKLEAMDYLSQPHTSAGRIPTDKGLRFYVDAIFEEAIIPEKKFDLPTEDFSLNKGDLSSVLAQASKILSDHSDNLGFVLSPKIYKINFHHVRLIKVAENKVMIIIISSSNFAITEIIQTKTYFTQVELDNASEYLNQNFKGKNLLFVRQYLLRELPRYKMRYENIMNKLMNLLKAYSFQEDRESQLFLQGTSKLLEKHDLFDMAKLKSLFHNFEEKAKLAKLLSDFISLDKVKVLIGSEMKMPDIADFSLVLSHYGYDREVLGSLGIMGPKRLPYKNIIPLVECVAKKLSQTISLIL